MTREVTRGVLMPLVLLGLIMAWGCGGPSGFVPEWDSDAVEDGIDVGDDVPVDGEPDVPVDGDEDVPTDVEEEDGGGPGRTYIPFEAETAGGEVISSTSYTLELFVAPARPVGDISSTSFQFKLGPGGIRSHR
jgi:hypothetical protein